MKTCQILDRIVDSSSILQSKNPLLVVILLVLVQSVKLVVI